jgi:ATP-dependent DNA helicase RecQ
MQVDQEGFDFLREQMNFKNRRDFRPEASVSILERWGCLQKSNTRFPYTCVTEPTDEMFEVEKPAEILKVQNQKLLQMVQWANLIVTEESRPCRLNMIYRYFGHEHIVACGLCDLCRDSN